MTDAARFRSLAAYYHEQAYICRRTAEDTVGEVWGGRYEIPLANRLTLSYPTCCLL